MKRIRVQVAFFAVAMLLSACAATSRAPDALQGSWVVVSAEHGGNDMQSVVGGVMEVEGDAFSIRTTSGNRLQGKLKAFPRKSPPQLDLVHDNGTRWIAIYDVDGETLRYNYIDVAQGEPRPTTFTTSPDTEVSLMILRRQSR